MTIYLFDHSKALIGELDNVLSYEQTQVLGGKISAEITSVYSKLVEDAHYFGSKDVDDPNIFWMYRVTSEKKRNGQIELTGIHLLFDELQGKTIRDIRPTNLDPATALGRILQNTDWQVGIQQATGTASSNFYYQSNLSAFWDFLKVWRVEFKPRLAFANGQITGRYIDIFNNVSGNFGKRFEYGDKLIQVEAEQANENIFTALIGLGKGEETGDGFGRKINFSDVAWSVANGDPVNKPVGQDYVELSGATAIYGFREAVIEFPDIEDKAKLLQATYLELLNVSRPKVEFSSSAIETGMIELGETVTIIRDDMGIHYQTRVFELTRNFLDGKIKNFKFGDRIITSSADRIKLEREKTDGKIKEQQSLLVAVRNQITDAYWGTDGYNYDLEVGNEYGLPAGLYSFDRPIDQNPTEVIYIGAGKALIANSKNVNGEWEWRTALTPEGFAGDAVVTGSITANKLAADVGQSLDLSSNESISLKVTSEVAEQLSDPAIQEQFKGDPGADGIDGKSVGTVTARYYLSTSPATLSGGAWSTTYLGWINGRYLWTKMVTEYSDGSTSETSPVNVTGMRGEAGRSIQSVRPEWYLSTSRTALVGGEWLPTMPTWIDGRFMWTRTRIVLNNPTESTYSEPVVHTELEAIAQKVVSNTANISITKTSIENILVSQSVVNDGFETRITTLTGGAKDTAEDWRKKWEKIIETTDDQGTRLEKIEADIRMEVDENFNPFIHLNPEATKSLVVHTQKGVYMLDNGVVTFEANDQQVKTTRLVVLQSIDFGNHTAQKIGDKYTIFLPNGGA